jgi:dTDP-4-dehydrorhamnose 3,5-epimerase
MKFTETPLSGAFTVDLEKREDERGFFARVFCAEEFTKHGMESRILQVNNSLSKDVHTLRGLHYQLDPFAETKLVRCVAGALLDVIVDVRPDSPTLLQYFSVKLTADNRRMLFVPRGFAHGIFTLQPDTEIFYMASQRYSPDHERGIRWNDPKIGIEWPDAPVVLSDKDRSYPDFDPAYHFGD